MRRVSCVEPAGLRTPPPKFTNDGDDDGGGGDDELHQPRSLLLEPVKG